MLGTLLLATVFIVVAFLYNHYTYWKRRGVIYDTPLPFLGNFKGVGSTYHISQINQRLYNKFKSAKVPFGGSYLFFRRGALLMDLDLIKNVLIKDFSNFHDRGAFTNVKDDPLTGHLVGLEGEHWRAMRTKLTPVFTSARMKHMFPTVVKVGESLAQTMAELLKTTPDQVLEIKELCARYTTDVIGNCAFGVECNSLKDPEAEFRRMGRAIFTERRHNPLVMAFMLTNAHLAKKLRMKLFPDHLSEFFLNVVRQTVEYRLKNNVKRNDFMDLLIEIKLQNEQEAKAGLTIEQMAAQTFVFFLAGFETSSTTMSHCLYELARNVDIQDELRNEIQQAVQQSQGQLTYELVNSMEYLEQVVCETLRKYPVLAALVRKAKNDYHIPNSTAIIEKGVPAIIPVYALHHDPEYWDEPAEFRPSRFTAEEVEKRHSALYLPFGDGPRNCIGARFGKMQTKIGLISLLQHYRFECCPLTEIPLQFDNKNFLITAKNGIYLKVISV